MLRSAFTSFAVFEDRSVRRTNSRIQMKNEIRAVAKPEN
jgi:hypothetical protein